MKYEMFTRQDIPYDILNKFGLSQVMIDDLPENVIERFLLGRTTPMLPITTENTEGKKVRSHARISLVRMEDGTVDVCFVPQWVDEDLSKFTKEQQEKLKLGEVTLADMPGKGLCFVQYDENISQVMAVPVQILTQNISLLTRHYNISDDEKEKIQNGGIIQMVRNNAILSIGIDLNDETGIRVANGDTISWKEDAKVDKLPKYNFGIFGCWIADEENALNYVAEENYTEEIEQEFKRKGSQNATSANLSQMKMS